MKLRLRSISKFTVRHLDLDVHEGEILTLLGESGSGKTTLLRIITGVETPDEGSVEIDSTVVVNESTNVPPEKRGVGMVFQNFCLFPHLRVDANIAFGLKNFSKNETKERVAELIEFCNLTGLEKRFPHQISGGQQQRVALARALANNPSVVLFDEPFSSLDEHLRSTLRDEMRGFLKQHKQTAIFVTHDSQDALVLSDRIAVLNQGVIEQQGTPFEIYNNPSSLYVARYFGTTNILKARAVEGGFDTAVGFVRNDHHATEGDQGSLSIRPHWCYVNDTAPLFYGNVVRSQYYGDRQEAVLDTAAGEITVHLHHHDEVKVGDSLGISIDAPRLKLIPI